MISSSATPPNLDSTNEVNNNGNGSPKDYSHLLIDGWFHERNDELWPGQALSIEVKQVLYHKPSLFQDILVFESTHYGTVLVLDGVIQATQRDEHRYVFVWLMITLFVLFYFVCIVLICMERKDLFWGMVLFFLCECIHSFLRLSHSQYLCNVLCRFYD
jgi:hypothetical protein